MEEVREKGIDEVGVATKAAQSQKATQAQQKATTGKKKSAKARGTFYFLFIFLLLFFSGLLFSLVFRSIYKKDGEMER